MFSKPHSETQNRGGRPSVLDDRVPLSRSEKSKRRRQRCLEIKKMIKDGAKLRDIDK